MAPILWLLGSILAVSLVAWAALGAWALLDLLWPEED